MFTAKDNVRFWAERLKYARLCRKQWESASGWKSIEKSNYAQLLTAAFTFLFNERQPKEKYHG